MTKSAKKLIEVALPLDAINKASVREGYIYKGNPSALHKWWAQRPLAAARAVLFAQMVDDPSARPDLFPTEPAQEKERQRLFRIIENLVQWENTTNEQVLQEARDEIWESWRRACAENADHPRASDLFNRKRLPAFYDPFAGGGSLPLEAQRLGLTAYASDLNPVPVLISKAMIEIPPKFAGRPPVNGEARGEPSLIEREWNGVEGLAEDVRYYGQWIRDRAEAQIGSLYPDVRITEEIARGRSDLTQYVGRELPVIAWLWARTVPSPNPAFSQVAVPLASTFMLSTRKGKEAYVEPIIEDDGSYRFEVRTGKPSDPKAARAGTKSGGSGTSFFCLMSGTPMPFEYLREQAKAGRMGARLMATVVEGDRSRLYLSPDPMQTKAALAAEITDDIADTPLPDRALGFRVQEYGMDRWRDLFTTRQLVALQTLSDLTAAATDAVEQDAIAAGLPDDGVALCEGGSGARAYGEAVGLFMAFATDKTAEYGCTIVPWYTKENRPKGLFARHAIPMVWDFAEVNPLGGIGGTFKASTRIIADALVGCASTGPVGEAFQADAATTRRVKHAVVSTDPPYYDNIGYADLSDFFYVWLRRSQRAVFPELLATMSVPKSQELIATPYRQGSPEAAEVFFLQGMTQAMERIAEQAHPGMPVSIYYAFKQSESRTGGGTSSTGWETFLEAVVRSGLSITGTWPIRTERGARSIGLGTNALASSIVLVCRPRGPGAPRTFRRDFRAALAAELPGALAHLQRGNIAPADLAQAAIGPGMAVFTRYSEVKDLEGRTLTVGEALALINEVLDECLAEQEGDFDADSRWAVAWYEQQGFAEGDFGIADTLSKAKNTSVGGLTDAGVVASKAGKVRLLTPAELPDDWSPSTDPRLTTWEIVHHLIRRLEVGGEQAAGELVRELGGKAEVARELAYRLYSIAERKKRAEDALRYNALVQSWPEISRLAGKGSRGAAPTQADIFESAGSDG